MNISEPSPKAAVIDYHVGNVGNVMRALRYLRIDHVFASSPSEAADISPDLLILPGVGAFRPAMERLTSMGWDRYIMDHASHGGAVLGICLGMQLMCSRSFEGGETKGLGLFDADVVRLEGLSKIPHMGWNTVSWSREEGWRESEDMYFVHSFAVMSCDDEVGSTDADGVVFSSALRRSRVMGVQFHPERSGIAGVRFLGSAIESLASERRSEDA